MKAQSTTLEKPADIQEKWYIVDAEGQVVGRLAARIAKLVRGKLTPTFATHQDPKIHVIVTNADKVVFTGAKLQNKKYYWHSGYRTGVKERTAAEMMDKKPEEVLRKAIHGMLPKNKLGYKMQKHLRLYKSGDYTDQHAAQKPEPLTIVTRTPKENKD